MFAKPFSLAKKVRILPMDKRTELVLKRCFQGERTEEIAEVERNLRKAIKLLVKGKERGEFSGNLTEGHFIHLCGRRKERKGKVEANLVKYDDAMEYLEKDETLKTMHELVQISLEESESEMEYSSEEEEFGTENTAARTFLFRDRSEDGYTSEDLNY